MRQVLAYCLRIELLFFFFFFYMQNFAYLQAVDIGPAVDMRCGNCDIARIRMGYIKINSTVLRARTLI